MSGLSTGQCLRDVISLNNQIGNKDSIEALNLNYKVYFPVSKDPIRIINF